VGRDLIEAEEKGSRASKGGILFEGERFVQLKETLDEDDREKLKRSERAPQGGGAIRVGRNVSSGAPGTTFEIS